MTPSYKAWRSDGKTSHAEPLDEEQLTILNEQAARQWAMMEVKAGKEPSPLAIPPALLFSRADATLRPAALSEYLDISAALNDVRFRAIECALDDVRNRSGANPADGGTGVGAVQARLDHLVSELGESSLANKRRLRQLTTEELIELGLRLQRPDKTSHRSSKPRPRIARKPR